MVFIENDVTMTAQSSKSKCVFFCNQTEILGVGVAAGVSVIAVLLAISGCILMKKKNSYEKDNVDDEIEVGISRVAIV